MGVPTDKVPASELVPTGEAPLPEESQPEAVVDDTSSPESPPDRIVEIAGALAPDVHLPLEILTDVAVHEEQEASPAPPPIPPIVDVLDLDWEAIEAAARKPPILEHIEAVVREMKARLEALNGPQLLFDQHRSNPEERAILVSNPPMPLWFIGDLHGDLLALEAALALVERDAANESAPANLVFLGDLFDDEGLGLAVLLRIFDLILTSPDRVCLVAGNHDEALAFVDGLFTSSVDPSDFAEFLNAHLADEPVKSAGQLAVHIFANAPRALFFPDGLLAAHGGFPLTDLHTHLAETGNWNDPQALTDFVWTRAHPKARKKLPNRYTRGSQFGYEDFAAFCALSDSLGRPVTHLVRGHDHVDDRYAIYAADKTNPILTTVALSRRLPRESLGPYARVPTLAKYVPGAVPQVYRLHIPESAIRTIYPEPGFEILEEESS